MTPRQLWLHFIAGCAVTFTLLLALVAWVWLLPRLAPEQRAVASAIVAWQVLAALILCGAGVYNMWWGFITAWPMRLMVASSFLSVWLFPLGTWAHRVWRDERIYLETWQQRMREENRRQAELRAQKSGPKLPPASEIK